MKNEFKKDGLYFTKDKKIGGVVEINDKAMIVQVEGVTYGYYLDGKIVLPEWTEDKDTYTLVKLFTKSDAGIMMNCKQKVQHLDWLQEEGGENWFYCYNQDHKIVDQDGNIISDWEEFSDGVNCWQTVVVESLKPTSLSMENYMGYLADTIAQIKAQPHYGCCVQKERYVMEEVFNSLNTNFSDYDTFCSENKAMAEFLTSLGYSQEQVSDIANGGKPKTEIQLLQAEVTEMEKDGMANANAIERFKRKIKSLHSTPTQNQNTFSLYKMRVQELSTDVIAMLDGESDYVSTGPGRGSMIFNLDTLENILSSYEEDMDDDNNDIGSDSSYQEFSALIEKVAMKGYKGLFLTNGGNHEKA